MNRRRWPVLPGACWEVLRFLFLFLLLSTDRVPGTGGAAGRVPWLLLFGSGQLVLAAGMLFLFLDPSRYAPFNGLLVLAKLLSVFSALLLIVFRPEGVALSIPALLSVWIVALLDLVVLGLLLAGRPPAAREAAAPPTPDSRPDYDETEVGPDDRPRG